jgi:hypothetical protein
MKQKTVVRLATERGIITILYREARGSDNTGGYTVNNEATLLSQTGYKKNGRGSVVNQQSHSLHTDVSVDMPHTRR